MIPSTDFYPADLMKNILAPVNLSGLSPHSLTNPDGIKYLEPHNLLLPTSLPLVVYLRDIRYLQRLQTVQRLDQFMPLPLICNIVKEARLSGDDKRIQYAHSIITSYGELMSLSVDGKPQLNKNTKKNTIHSY